MLNIDPQLFQPKVIRMSTTSSIGLPGQHIIRTTEYSNSQVMSGTRTRNESNNNVITANDMDMGDEYDVRSYNSNDTRKQTGSADEGDGSGGQPTEWTTDQMCWSEDGDISDSLILERVMQQNSTSVMSFESNLSNSTASASFHSQMSEHSESKEELISSLLNKIRSQSDVEASKILLALSSSVENCIAMRQTGYLPLLVQLLHSPEENANDAYHTQHAQRINFEVRERIIQVMHNVVFSQPDDKTARREARVLRLLEQIRDYCDQLRNLDVDIDDNRNDRCVDQHLGPAVAALMKLSFDEDHRFAMCQLGGLQAIAELLQVDHEVHGCTNDQYCITIRRYAGMALTNLTFGDGANKALLCSMRPFMEALVAQLYSPSEDLRQVTASVLRNLSWRADSTSKRILRDVGAVTTLMKAALEAEKESTLKSILSALWNLSAHCSSNKADICHVDGSLAFLVGTLTYNSKSKTLAIVENGGGILRNVSSHIAIQNDFRIILRKHNCLQILLKHLKSPSLTVVSNACGTLWNLSARNAVDQRALWEMGAVSMLKKLINSKHKMISMGSSAALKNLLSAKPAGLGFGLCDSYMYNADMPSLHVRKQKALSTEIDQNLSETYDNTDSPKTSPSKNDKKNRVRRHMSPSAYGMTAQKMKIQRSEIPSCQPRRSEDEKGTLVVEEKHNGAFQVTKNTKQGLNHKQEQQRLPNDTKDHTSHVPRFSNERNKTTRMDTDCDSKLSVSSPSNLRLNQKVGIGDRQHSNADEPNASKIYKSDRNMPSQMAVKKDYHTSERQTNSAQRERVKDEQSMLDQSSKIPTQISGQSPGKSLHDSSRIPLPKSFKSLDSQRSVSVSPVAQRRSIPQKLETSQNVDHTVTHPKHAWNASYEKEDNEPEEPINLSKRHSRYDYAKEQITPPPQVREHKPSSSSPYVNGQVQDDEDDAKGSSNKDSPPKSSLLLSSENYVDHADPPPRCSLNIKTTTNVKLTRNHPLLSNFQQRDDDVEATPRAFESRQQIMEARPQHERRGKTVVFDVDDEEFEIEETLSMLSRSSSVASISSFDQQSDHDDESITSDISRHTSGVESPSELLDSPYQTAPSSLHKMDHLEPHMSRSGSEASMDRTEAVQGGTDDTYSDDAVGEDGNVTIANRGEHGDHFVLAAEESEDIATSSALQASQTSTISTKRTSVVDEISNDFCGETAKIDASALSHLEEDNGRKCVNEDVGFAVGTESMESLEVISPTEDTLIEECVPKANAIVKMNGARQKTPQLSYAFLRDTIEMHPNSTRSYKSERGKSMQSLEVKEYESESLSENEEKGKEDERKAEKNKLFRIPESPVDKKNADGLQPSSSEKTSSKTRTLDATVVNQISIDASERSQVVDQDFQQNKLTSNRSSQPVSSQLDFLMSHKNTTSDKQTLNKTIPENFTPESGASTSLDTSSLKGNDCNAVANPDVSEDDKNTKESTEAIKALELSTTEAEFFERDPDCYEKNRDGDFDENMLTSSMLGEAREIANALLGARVGSTEDMTVSTLSCLSDIDNARPPSVMAELGSLSMNSSLCDDGLKAAISKECQKLFGKHSSKPSSSSKKSLLRELQMGRITTDYASNDVSQNSGDSPDNFSLKSSCTSDLLGNMNPPTIMDDMSLTASTGNLSDIECDSEKKGALPYFQDSISERINDAAAMAQLYAKELSNITGNCAIAQKNTDGGSHIKLSSALREMMEVHVADFTDIGCDTIGSDTELDDDFPCDDDDPGSETLQAPIRSSLSKEETGEGSTENLTFTLTEEPPQGKDKSPYQAFDKSNGFHMTADEFRALQENADMILNTLKTVEIDEYGDMVGLSATDMLDDETMSLVSNESDEEHLSPDGKVQTRNGHRGFPRSDFQISPVYNGMVAPPQCSNKSFVRNSSFSQFSGRKNSIPSGLPPRSTVQSLKTRYSYPNSELNNGNFSFDANGTPDSKTKVPSLPKKAIAYTTEESIDNTEDFNGSENSVFDSRTFTKKRSTIPKNRIPFIPSASVPSIPNSMCPSIKSNMVKSPSANSSLSSFSSNSEASSKTVMSKIASAWPNSAKPRSKSAVDPNRNGKLRLQSANSSGSNSSISSRDEDKCGPQTLQRASMQSPSPQKSRSSAQDKLNAEEDVLKSQSIRRPSTLAITPKIGSPRAVRDNAMKTQTEQQKETTNSKSQQSTASAILSPSSNTNGIPRLQNKGSMIPSRRSMIPKPGKFGTLEN